VAAHDLAHDLALDLLLLENVGFPLMDFPAHPRSDSRLPGLWPT